MSEDSIFIVKVGHEEYLLRFERKKLEKKNPFMLFIIHIRKFWGGEKKDKK